MAKVRARKETGKLFFDFRYRGVRCREQTLLSDTPANRKKVVAVLQRISAEITLGTFDYRAYFPNSLQAAQFDHGVNATNSGPDSVPLFSEFADEWYSELKITWRERHAAGIDAVIKRHLNPTFGSKRLTEITKADILKFRSSLGELKRSGGKTGLSAERINHIMTPLRMILREGADRYGFATPYRSIKPLKVQKTDIDPFTLDEVKLILKTVRPDFRNYYTVRFFTGMRTGEIDGLKWKYVDFPRRQIIVQETLNNGKVGTTKTDSSRRAIAMSEAVYDALKKQKELTGDHVWVFAAPDGNPWPQGHVAKRVWYPLLRHLGLKSRRPYQTRHTAATLMLAAGENPEFIARQLGHSTAEMLFRVYSRFVPNLTRRDGSAFEKLINSTVKDETNEKN